MDGTWRAGAGMSESSTRATSCIVGRSMGCHLVHSRAWNAFWTSPMSVHVNDTSESTASIIVLSSSLDIIYTHIETGWSNDHTMTVETIEAHHAC